MRVWLALTLLLVPAVQAEPYVTSDGVQYYMAMGRIEGSSMTTLEGTALPFEGCAFLMLRPDLGHGTVRVVGYYGNTTAFHLTTDVGAGGMKPALESNVTRNGVVAEMAGRGLALLRIDAEMYPDPARGEAGNRTASTFYVTRADQAPADGVRLRIESLPGAPAGASGYRMAPDPELPEDWLLPSEAHHKVFSFRNEAFLGKATVRIEAEALSPAGSNALTLEVRSPSGHLVGNTSVAPALQSPDSGEFSFDLLEFGEYFVVVEGKVAFARYHVEATIDPPDHFGLEFAWDQVAWGADAQLGFGRCRNAVESGLGFDAQTSLQVARAIPPGYNLEAVVVGIGAAAVAATVAIVLVSHRVASSELRKRFKS
jgi:hypothetical protein